MTITCPLCRQRVEVVVRKRDPLDELRGVWARLWARFVYWGGCDYINPHPIWMPGVGRVWRCPLSGRRVDLYADEPPQLEGGPYR